MNELKTERNFFQRDEHTFAQLERIEMNFKCLFWAPFEGDAGRKLKTINNIHARIVFCRARARGERKNEER